VYGYDNVIGRSSSPIYEIRCANVGKLNEYQIEFFDWIHRISLEREETIDEQ